MPVHKHSGVAPGQLRGGEEFMVRTSSEMLNQLLGGWLIAAPNMIYGDPDVGKTTLVIDAIVNLYKPEVPRSEQSFYVIDTERTMYKARIEQICRARGMEEELLDRVHVLTASSQATNISWM